MDGGIAEVGVRVPDGDKEAEGGGGTAEGTEIVAGTEFPVGAGKGVLHVGVPGGVPP